MGFDTVDCQAMRTTSSLTWLWGLGYFLGGLGGLGDLGVLGFRGGLGVQELGFGVWGLRFRGSGGLWGLGFGGCEGLSCLLFSKGIIRIV